MTQRRSRLILVMYSTHQASEEHLHRLCAMSDGIEVRVVRDEADAYALARHAEIILGHRYLRQCLPNTQVLRWVQSTAGGVNYLPLELLDERKVRLTRMSIASGTIARHAVTMAWAMNRCLPQALTSQHRHRWDPHLEWLPAPQRALVVGTGSIGTKIAELLRRDGLQVWGVRRHPSEASAPFHRMSQVIDMDRLLPEIDWCFLALPDSLDAHGLFNEKRLCRLPARALIVNVGHSSTIVTEDLCRVLHDGHLGGAALDVVDPHRRNADDPIWSTPRLLITPHVAAHSAERGPQIERYVEGQVARYLAGQPLQDEAPTAGSTANA